MLRRHTVYHRDGVTDVAPNIYLQGTELVVDAFSYVWRDVPGSVPEIRMQLTSDPAKDQYFVAILYENDTTHERQVVTDTGEAVVPPTTTPIDEIMRSQGWSRCFMVAQACVPKGAALDDASVYLDAVQFIQAPLPEGQG